MRRIVIMSLAVVTIVLTSIALTYTAMAPANGGLAPPLRMYDSGATLVYAASNEGVFGETSEIRVVSVLYGYIDQNTEAYHVVIRDSFGDQGFTSVVNWETREIVETDYPDWEGTCVEYWIPTDVSIGDHVNILHYENVQVVGERRLTVDGIQVDCWALRISVSDDGIMRRDAWYYEKQTGIWVGASWVRLDTLNDPDEVLDCWAGTLISTNVPLPPARGEPIDR